jgi:hypothetical protein
MADASDPYASLMTPLTPSAPPTAPDAQPDPYDILTKPLLADPGASVSGYVAAGGRPTWSDVWQGVKAGGHDVAAEAAGAVAAVQGPGPSQAATQSFALSQEQAAREAEQGMTPAGQQPGFFKHPLVSAAEAAPGVAAIAAPAALAGPFAPAVVSGLMGGQQLGAAQNRAAGQGYDLTPAQKLTQFGIGAATGLVPELGLTGKIVTTPLIDRALGVVEGATTFGAGAAGGEAVSQQSEIAAGKRKEYDPSAILSAGEEGAEQGAGFKAAHSGVHRDPTQTGGKATVPRTPPEQRATETLPRAKTAPPKDATAAGPAPPTSPLADPTLAAGAKEAPVPTPANVTQASKPQDQTVQQPPPVAQPTAPPPRTATEAPQTADTTRQAPPPQPAPEGQPAPAVATPTAAPPPADPALLARQQVELVDPSHPRDAMIVPKGAQVPDLTQFPDAWRYGKAKLPGDGGTVVYDHSPRGSGWRKDSLKAAAADGTLQDKIDTQAAKAPQPSPVAGAKPAPAPERAEAPGVGTEAPPPPLPPPSPTPAPREREQPSDVQPKDVQPEGVSQTREQPVTQASKAPAEVDPLAGASLVAQNKAGVAIYRAPDGSLIKKGLGGDIRPTTEATAKILFPKEFGGEGYVPAKSEADTIREAAEAEAARLKLAKEPSPPAEPKGRVLRSETPEEARAAAAQAEADRAAAERVATEQPAKPATRQTKEPELQQPGKKSEPEKEAMRASNAVADEVVRNNLPQAGDEHAPDPTRGSGGKGSREQVKRRVEKMVKEATERKFQFMKMIKDRKDPELAHSASSILLHEAKRLADLKVAKTSDYKRFLDRERDLLKGEAAKTDVLKERRAAGKEFAAAAGKGVKETATEGVGEETTGEAPDVAEEYEKAKERVAEEKVAQAPGEKREETTLQKQAREASERARAKLAEQEKGPRERPLVPRESEEEEPAVRGFKQATGFKVEAKKGRFQRQEGEAPPEKIKLTDWNEKEHELLPSRTTDAETMLRDFKPEAYKSALSGIVSKLRDTLVQVAGDTPVHYISDEEMQRLTGRSSLGAYDNHDDVILINRDHSSGDTPLHEVFHAATSKAIRKNPELRDQMERLRVEVVKGNTLLKADAKRFSYYLGNAEEFLTGMMTHPEFQNLLKGVRISDQLAKDIGIPKWRKSTMWEGALTIIRKALRLGPRDTSAIEAAMAITENTLWRDPRGAGLLMEATGKLARHQMDRFLRNATEEPEQEGRALGRSVKDWTGRVGESAKDALTDRGETFKTAAERVLSEPQMYDTHRDLFKDGKLDPMRDRLDAMQRRGGRAEELSEPGHKLASEWNRLTDKHGADAMAKLQDVMRMANEFDVYPHEPLGEGQNGHLGTDTLANKQARAVHPEISKKWEALPEDLQDHFLREGEHFKDDLNAIRETNAKNFIEGLDPPAGSTVKDVLDRMLSGTLTDADKEYYSRLGVEGMDTDVFQHRKGPYFPAGRFGDFVVRADHEVLTPLGSDRDFHGNQLEDNVRRFDSEPELDKYLAEVNLPARVSRKYYFDNPAGGRIYQVPDAEGNLRNVAHDEAGIGYGKPKHEFWAVMQHKRVEFAKSLSAGQDIHDRLKAAGVKNLTGVEHYRGKGVDKSFTSPQVQALLSNIDKRRDLTELQKSAMKDAIRETAIVSQSGSKITKNFVRSQKIQGAEYGGEALLTHSLASARYRAAAEFQPKIDRAFEAMRQVMSDNPDDKNTTARSRVFNELAQRSYNATPENMYPSYSPVVQKLLQASFIQDMASVSHLLTHQVNLHYMAAAVLAPRHGMAIFRRFYNIMREAGGPWMATKRGFGMAITKFRDPEADYTSMFDMMRNSITDPRRRSVVDDLAATQHIHKDSGVDAIDFARQRGAMDKVSRFIRNVTGSMDSMGRFVTGLAAYDAEYAKNGGDHDAALLYARQSIEKGLVHYGAGMRAPAFSGKLARVMSQFRLPGMNMLYLLGRNAYLAFRSADMATRHEAWWALGSMLLGGWALSGSSALPTEPLKVMEILGSQLGITPSPSEMSSRLRLAMADEFGPTVANTLMDGPLSLLGSAGPSLAHRVASPELSFGEPDSTRPQDAMSWLAQFTFGATGSLGVNVMRGSQALMKGDYENAIKYLSPKQIADMARAYQIYEGDADQKKPFSMPPQGLAAALMQGFGIRSQTTVRQGEGKHALSAAVKALPPVPKGHKGERLKAAQAAKVKSLTREYESAYQ